MDGTTKLLPFDGAEYDVFGWSVSILGDYATVSAYDSAYIFKREGEAWIDNLSKADQATAICNR
jgi:hypothetical protein